MTFKFVKIIDIVVIPDIELAVFNGIVMLPESMLVYSESDSGMKTGNNEKWRIGLTTAKIIIENILAFK
jgi:hypothetical protein